MSEGARERSRVGERIAARREAYRARSRVYRIVFVTTGAIVTACGLAMLLLPGPAFVVIPIGLTMLAMEFAWAEEMLERAVEQAEKAQRTAAEASRAQRVAGIVAVTLGTAAFVTAAILWDIPVLPV